MKTLRKILLLTALFHYFLANQLQLYTFIYVQVITFCYNPRGADLCREKKNQHYVNYCIIDRFTQYYFFSKSLVTH